MSLYKNVLYRPKTNEASKSYSFLKPAQKHALYTPSYDKHTQSNHSTRNSVYSYMLAHSASTKKATVFHPVLPYEEPAALLDLKVLLFKSLETFN